MHATWRNQNDFMEDIWALSEMEGIGSHEIEEPPPATILEYRAQMAANNTGSIYDTPEFGDPDVTYIMSGRGRGGYSTILRPGVSQYSDNLVTEDVQKKIRQVAGVGYSNAMIEEGVKAMIAANNNIKTTTVTQSANSSKTSSPYKTSGLCPALNQERSPSSCSSGSSLIENGGPPPPLSVMRKKAEEERARKKERAQEAPLEKIPDKKSPGSPGKGQKTAWRAYEEKIPDRKSPGSSSNGPKTAWQVFEEKIPDKKNPGSPSNGARMSWRGSSPGSSSDEGSWRRRDGNTTNRFFRSNGFNLNCKDFPALK